MPFGWVTRVGQGQQFWGSSGPLQSTESLLRCMQQKNQQRHHSNWCRRLHCNRLAAVTLTFSFDIPPPWCGLPSKFVDHLLEYVTMYERAFVTRRSYSLSSHERLMLLVSFTGPVYCKLDCRRLGHLAPIFTGYSPFLSPWMWSQDGLKMHQRLVSTTPRSREADVSSRLFASHAQDVILPKFCKPH